MPFYTEPARVLPTIGYAPPQPQDKSEGPSEALGGLDVLGAAFRRENLIGAVVEELTAAGGFQPDPNHNPLSVIGGTRFEELYLDQFVGSRSEAETRATMAEIAREEQDRDILDAAGGWGTAAALGAAILDPTSLLPGGTIARAGRLGWRVGTSALAVSATAAGATTIQEAGLQAMQRTRTASESGVNIAGAAVLGGILGGAAGGVLGRDMIARVGQMIERAPETLDEVKAQWESLEAEALAANRPASAGAASVDRGDAVLKGSGVDSLAAKMGGLTSPLLRTQTSEAEATRILSARLAESARTLAQNAEGRPVQTGGAVETRVKMWNGPLAQALTEVDTLYSRYRYGRGARLGDETLAEVSGLLRIGGGRLTPTEFRIEVGRAMRRGDQHDIPEVAEAARVMRAKIFEPGLKAAVDAGIPGFFEGMTTKTAPSYLTRLYNRERIIARRNEWIDTLVAHLEGGQAKARREIEALKAERSAEDLELLRAQTDLAQNIIPVIGRARQVDQRTGQTVELGIPSLSGRLRDQRAPIAREARGDLKEFQAAQREVRTRTSEVQRDAMQPYRSLLRDLRRGRGEDKPVSLIDNIRGRGGINTRRLDAIGRTRQVGFRASDLKAMGADKVRGLLNSKNAGVDIDNLVPSLIEEGYLPTGATLDDVVELIRREIAGEQVFSEFDQGVVAYNRMIADTLFELDKRGFDVKAMTPEDLERALAADDAAFRSVRERAVEIDDRLADLVRRVEEAAEKFDAKALRLDDLDAAIREAEELAPFLMREARELRKFIRDRQKAMRRLDQAMDEPTNFADLTREELRAIADQVTDEILGAPDGRMAFDIDGGPRGPLKSRTLSIRDDLIEDFLESDVGLVSRSYVSTVAPDVELFREFGDNLMEGEIAKVTDEYNARIAGAETEAERIRLNRLKERDISDLAAMRDRIRGVYKLPSDPRGIMLRTARVVKDWNFMAMLGGMTVSAIPDIARPVMVHGLANTMRSGWVPLVSNWSKLKPA